MSASATRPDPTASVGGQITRAGRWMALVAALLGWMFDGAEMGLFSLVGKPAIEDLLAKDEPPPVGEATSAPADSSAAGEVQRKSPEDLRKEKVSLWFGVVIAIFLVGAATGGVLFGWLGDRLGRVRAMSLSVLTYALFTGMCGLTHSPLQMAVLRFIAALGMGGEWALGVSLVMEVWPNRSRAFMAGLIGAAANVGYVLVGFLGLVQHRVLDRLGGWLIALGVGEETSARLVSHGGWRLLMLCGALPALLTFFVRMFVPESEKWEHERARGGTSHWASRDLVAVVLGVLGPAGIIYLWARDFHTALRLFGTLLGVVIAAIGFLYPVLGYLRRESAGRRGDSTGSDGGRSGSLAAADNTLRRMLLGAGLSGVALLGTWGSIQWTPAWADTIEGDRIKLAKALLDHKKVEGESPTEIEKAAAVRQPAKEWTQIWQSLGAVVGTLIAAALGDLIGRRPTYVLMCILSFASILLLYWGPTTFNAWFLTRAFLGGLCTAAFYGWLPLYLPELFRTSVRATAQGFAFNFGRIVAAVGALQTAVLFQVKWELADGRVLSGHPLACSAMSLIYVLGLVLICFAPETKGRPLPD